MLSAGKAHDPELVAHEDHLRYRTEQFARTLRALEESEGSLEAFADGAKRFGLVREPGRAETTFREWAPAAVEALLLADFNDWKGTPLQRDRYGVWSAVLPDLPVEEKTVEGGGGSKRPAIAHGQRYRLRLRHPGGWWVDVIPAWARRCVLRDPDVMGSRFDAEHWSPERDYEWRHPRPKPMLKRTTAAKRKSGGGGAKEKEGSYYPPPSLRIYEAHVGMSSEDPHVASYAHFADSVLPRIAGAGYNAVQLMAVAEHAYYGSFGYHVTSPFAVSSRCGTPDDLKRLVDVAHGLGLLVILDVVHSHASSNEEDGIAGLDLGSGEAAGGAGGREQQQQQRQSAITDPSASYFAQGAAGRHDAWDSRLFAYGNWETLRYLLSNLRFWVEEFRFDGFRFDGVTSMLYHHHGLGVAFEGGKSQYFSPSTNVDAVVYLMLANALVHRLLPGDLREGGAVSIAEDVSGMPGLCRPVCSGGVGFDARLGMGLPDLWARLLGSIDSGGGGTPDEAWDPAAIVAALCNRGRGEPTVAYVESHDQSLVGDVPVAWRLMGGKMYDSMAIDFEEREVERDEEGSGNGDGGGLSASKKENETKKKKKKTQLVPAPPKDPTIARGLALHKVIRALTASLGGDAGWLSFMGNEFGHPEWVDFPRDGNGWSHDKARRQWSLAEPSRNLRYSQLGSWDRLLMELDEEFGFMGAEHLLVSHAGVGIGDKERTSGKGKDQVIVAERGPLVFVFNLSPSVDHAGYKIGVPDGGKYRVVADSDAAEFGGRGLLGWRWNRGRSGETLSSSSPSSSSSCSSGGGEYFSNPAGVPGLAETNFNNRAHSILVGSPARSAVVYARVVEGEAAEKGEGGKKK